MKTPKIIYALFDTTETDQPLSLIGTYLTKDKAQQKKEDILLVSQGFLRDNLIIAETTIN